MTDAGHRRPPAARLAQGAAGLLSLVTVVVAATTVRPGHLPGAVPVLVALLWAAALPLLDALLPRRAGDTGSGEAPWTTVVRLGAEPDDVARTTIGLASDAGPTMVVTARPREAVVGLVPLGTPLISDPDLATAVAEAARRATTEGVLLLSAGAFPVADTCRRAAGRLGPDVAWVVGRSRTFNRDGFAPVRRELLGEQLRARARAAGADLWERDATLVRRDVLAGLPAEPDRPWGRWLRAARRRGGRGATVDEVLALRVMAPTAEGFWPTTVTRQRAQVADLADATTTGPIPARAVAGALLLRELYAYPALLVVLAPIPMGISGRFPFTLAPLALLALVGAGVAARWAALRWAHDCPLRPRADLVAAVFDLPGSLLALPAAMTRRARASRVRLSDRPLVWLALLLTGATAIPLVSGRASGGGVGRVAAALALVELALLWQFTLRALLRRSWARQGWRTRLDLPVTLGDRVGRAVDASAAGVGIAGPFGDVAVGARSSFAVRGADDQLIEAEVVVASTRPHPEGVVVGCELLLAPADVPRWAALVLVATAPGQNAPPRRPTRRRREGTTRWPERIGIAAVGVLTVPAVAVLGLLLLGYRPLVVRSPSMVPTFQVGDVAVVEVLGAGDLRPGDVVTFRADGTGESITHRVRAVVHLGGTTTVETRGDANVESEHWTRPDDAALGRVVWRVPRAGAVLAAVGDHRSVLNVLVGLGLAVVAGVLHLSRRPGPLPRLDQAEPG